MSGKMLTLAAFMLFATENLLGSSLGFKISRNQPCISGLPNLPQIIQQHRRVAIPSHIQVVFPDIEFLCNGIITQLKAFYQIQGDPGIIEMPLTFQVWNKVNTSYYELNAEVKIPQAVGNTPIILDNLTLPFYNRSVVGFFVEFTGSKSSEFVTSFGDSDEIPPGYYSLGSKLCEMDTNSEGLNFISVINPEFMISYVTAANMTPETSVSCVTPPIAGNDDDDDDDDDDIPVVFISVGVIVPIVTIIVIVLVIVLVVWRIKHKQKTFVVVNHLETNPHYDRTIDRASKSDGVPRGNSISLILKDLTNPLYEKFKAHFIDCMINPSCLKLHDKIAEGAFGKVYKGIYIKGDEEVTEVAIKVLKVFSPTQAEEFMKECIFTKKFDHPNVLSLIGVSQIKEEGVPLMVLPYMCNGDVKSFLQSKRGDAVEVVKFPEGISNDLLTKICLDIAKGMEYLSSLRYVHRDLAARNCMLDDNLVAKVSDFGLTRDTYISDYYKLDHCALLPVKWLAPEALLDKKFTMKTDVWSFGITCWEVFTLGLQPYPTVSSSEMLKYLKSGGVPDQPPLSSDKMYIIMTSCWNLIPEERSTFTQLVEKINQKIQ